MSRLPLGVTYGDIHEHLHLDADGNIEGIEYTQDVESVVKWCHDASDSAPGRELRHVGRYPVGELLVYGKANGINDPCWYLKKEYSDLLTKLVNDSSHARLRVWKGRV